jgi:superfamily II DNA or RNA helicase
MSLALRPYQLDAVERVRCAARAGKSRILLVVPTGGGKTVICAAIASDIVSRGGRILFLAHRAELIDQAAGALERAGLTVGAICSSASTPPNPFAPVQVASVQTLLARNVRPPADVILPDEAHHFGEAAEQWSALLRSYPDAQIVGPTATPERGDGTGLAGSFDSIVVGATVRELTAGGYLVPCRVLRPDKPLSPGELAQDPVDAYFEHASGRRAVVFARSVPYAEQYAASFEARGVVARAISADTPWAERRLYIDAFRRGTIQVLVNVYVLTEGFDAPEVSCCILVRGAGSAGMYLQMVGRVLRPAPGKTDALVLDLRGVSHEHGLPEDEREYSLEGRGIRLRDPNSYCPVCGALKPPGEACGSCDYAPSGEDNAKPDRVVGAPLKPYHRLRVEEDPARARRLANWIVYARRHGYKDGWWKAKFHAVYGVWPSAFVTSGALAIAFPAQRSA